MYVIIFSLLLSLFNSLCQAVWHAITDHDDTRQRSAASLTEREGPHTLTKSFTSFPINYWHAVVSWKGSQTFRWSVWWIFQLTNRPPDTLHQSNVWLERGHSFWPQSYTCVYTITMLLFCFKCYTYCLFTLILLTAYLPQFLACSDFKWLKLWLHNKKIRDLSFSF